VGHVLHKIDGEQSQQHTEPIRQWWEQLKSKPRPHIFWNFIEEERNTILKEYRTLAREDVSIRLGGTQLAFNAPPDATRHDLPGTTEYHYTMRDGPFKGRDPRDLIREGIQWWEDELEIIEAAVRKQRRTDR
jgi:hypothetical protein